MESWLAELEMEMETEIDLIPSLINNPYHQGETLETFFSEQLAASLGDEDLFPYAASNTNYPRVDLLSTPRNSKGNNNNDIDNITSSDNVHDSWPSKNKEKTKKQAVSSGTKRKRQPSQVQDHVMAERKRRELLSQLFISLSAMVPGLKKCYTVCDLGARHYHCCGDGKRLQ